MTPMQKARTALPLQAKPASAASMELHQPSGRHAWAHNQEGQNSAQLDPRNAGRRGCHPSWHSQVAHVLSPLSPERMHVDIQ